MATGADVARLAGPRQMFDSVGLAWTPDSRWLLASDARGLVAWNVEMRTSTRLDLSRSTPIALAVVEH